MDVDFEFWRRTARAGITLSVLPATALAVVAEVDEYSADNRRLANRVGELEGWLHAADDDREAVERERDEARAEVAKLRALLGEVAQLGNVEHDPDGDCRGNWDDEPCDDDCHIADHNALMDQVRAVVATWQAT